MASVWIVERGDYDSDIVGVFSTKEKAKAFGDPLGLDVDEYVLDVEKAGPVGMRSWRVVIELTGDVRGAHESNYVPLAELKEHDVYRDRLDEKGRRIPYKALIVSCWARDREHAIKIADEKRQEYLVKQATEAKS